MIDETPRAYSIRCRRCADSVMIDVAFGVTVQTGYVECRRGHVTPYRFDGATVTRLPLPPTTPSTASPTRVESKARIKAAS